MRRTRRSNSPPPSLVSGDVCIGTLHEVTASSTVEVTDQEKVENLLTDGRTLSCQFELEDGKLYFHGYDGFRVRSEDNKEIGKYHGVGLLLHELREYFAEGEELIIHGIGNEKTCFPLCAYQFRATPEAVYYSDLGTDEEKVEVNQ